MKVTLEFNLPDEEYELKLAQSGAVLSRALDEVSQELRRIDKYSAEEYQQLTGPEAISLFRKKFFEILAEYGAEV